ncbi:MAG TPA: mandelate racemase/muconate lactonizing enzyme family protein [Solirubrobacteraceae bacterium]|nr:mandelate racemase/muconate lactonizing enzyme family protein [Solirubrobacteraceae bacterium]
MKLAFERRTLRFADAISTSYGELTVRELVAVTITGDDGVVGHGEAAPLQAYDGVGVEQVEAALSRYVDVLASSGQLNGAQLIEACRQVADLPAALAGVDLALWDHAGRARELPLAALITDDPAPAVPVNATLSARDRAGVADQAAAAVTAGFGCVKLKVGLGDDAGRVAAARAAAGPELALRLDANGAWDVEQAVRTIDALAPAGLELVEEPVHGLQRVREVRERVAVRVAIDETAVEHGALGAGVADAVCLKISRCGGISGLIAAAALVRASGAEPYVASTYDGPLGIAAGVHAAAALASRGPVPYCGLATLDLFEGIDNPLPARAGRIAVPAAPGLGVEPL